MNGLRNFTLNHNETLTAKTDYKNEISVKNWIGSTWVAKSQLWKKSTLLVKRQLSKSQRLVKVNSQTVNSGQRSTQG
jgi:hypothetical protein